MEYKSITDMAQKYAPAKKDEAGIYSGFSLLETKTFNGPTSVKYWM